MQYCIVFAIYIAQTRYRLNVMHDFLESMYSKHEATSGHRYINCDRGVIKLNRNELAGICVLVRQGSHGLQMNTESEPQLIKTRMKEREYVISTPNIPTSWE